MGVLVVSILAIVAVAAGLVAANVAGGEGPPDLRVTVREAGMERSGGAVYEVVVRNEGGQTGENVVVEVTLGDETREIEILSVAKDDQEIASVIFPAGTRGEATAEVLSYHETTRG